MKIAYITTGTPHDKNSWSGTNYYVKKALEDQGHQVYCIYKYKKNITLKDVIYKLWAKLRKKRYQADRTLQNSKKWGIFIQSHLTPDTDAIISLSTIPIAFLKTNIPIFIYIDGIYEYMLKQGFNGVINNPKEAHKIEQKALDNCSKILTSSIASSEVILKDYNVSQNKISIIPLGANLDEIPLESKILSNIKSKSMKICKILFVGVDWERKGTNIVIQTVKALHESNFPIELHLVGLKKIPIHLPEYIINHGYISKMDPLGFSKITKLYLESHFLFVPSLGEAYGLVFSEASAFGLPSISHSVGGIPTIIKNGENGQLFRIGTSPEEFADYIKKIFNNEKEYKRLAIKSYSRFKDELNWTVNGQRISNILNEYIKTINL